MECCQDQKEQRGHREVDRQCHRAVRQEPAQLLQVAQGLGGGGVAAQPGAHGRGERRPVEQAHQPLSADLEQPGAGEVENAQEQEQAQHERSEHAQRVEAARCDHPVVDLQRVERHAQLQDIDDEAHRGSGGRPAGGIPPGHVQTAPAHAAAESAQARPLASSSVR